MTYVVIGVGVLIVGGLVWWIRKKGAANVAGDVAKAAGTVAQDVATKVKDEEKKV